MIERLRFHSVMVKAAAATLVLASISHAAAQRAFP